MVVYQEKRQYPRVEVRWPILLRTTQGDISGETMNITSDGALLRCQESLELNEVFDLVIHVPALVQPITITAQVIHSAIPERADETMPCEIGIRFTEISDKHRWLISAAIQRESGVMLMP